MAYNVAVDIGKIADLVDKLETYRTNIEDDIEAIYSTVSNMQNHWDGVSYQTFYNECYTYASSLQALVVLLAAFSKMLGSETGPAADTLNTGITTAFSKLG